MTQFDPKFILTEEMIEKCSEFAKNSVGSSADKYARRNQFNIDKIMYDIKVGKLGEEGVYQKISQLYPDLSKPDYKIYDKKDKSWDSDLSDPIKHIKVGVKTQDIKSEVSYGRSWVFQYRAGKNYDSDTGIFKNSDTNNFVCFVSVNLPKRVGEIRGIVKVQWLHEQNLFKPMKLKNLQNNKVAVYYEDLEKQPSKLFQL